MRRSLKVSPDYQRSPWNKIIKNPDLAEDIVKGLGQCFVLRHMLKYLCKQARYTYT